MHSGVLHVLMSNSASAASQPKQLRYNTTWLKAQPFAFGAIAACTSTVFIQPADFLKTRMQLSGELGETAAVRNPLVVAQRVLAQEGVLGFYSGLSAALFRQATCESALADG